MSKEDFITIKGFIVRSKNRKIIMSFFYNKIEKQYFFMVVTKRLVSREKREIITIQNYYTPESFYLLKETMEQFCLDDAVVKITSDLFSAIPDCDRNVKCYHYKNENFLEDYKNNLIK